MNDELKSDELLDFERRLDELETKVRTKLYELQVAVDNFYKDLDGRASELSIKEKIKAYALIENSSAGAIEDLIDECYDLL